MKEMSERWTRRTGPAEDLVTPESGSFIEVLHQRVVPPQSHPIYGPPLILVLVVCIVIGVLENICGVVCEGMWHAADA